jgi:hypothetical protein
VDRSYIYLLSADGKVKQRRKVDLSENSVNGFVYDLAPGPDRLIVTDIYNGRVAFFGSSGKAVKSLTGLCSSNLNRRVAYLNGNLYVPCEQSGAVMVVDGQGHAKGYLEAKGASFARAGHDGFLYVLADGEIRKYKPL